MRFVRRVLLFDGSLWREYRAKYTREGLAYLSGKSWVVLSDDLVQITSGGRAVVCVAAPPLADHVALERARDQIALAAVFRSGGDLMRILQIAAVVVPVLASVYLAWVVSGITAYQSKIDTLVTILNNSPFIKH
jgi:hypothetical protein